MKEGPGIVNCYNKGNIAAERYIGGIVGGCVTKTMRITMSYNTGNISGNEYIGGVCGQGAHVTYSYNEGNITGETYLGGIMGTENPGTYVDNSYNTGNITASGGTDSYKKILSGIGGETVLYSYNTGNITSNQKNVFASGITALNYSNASMVGSCTVVYCYNTGTISVGDSNYSSAFCIRRPGSHYANYYLVNTTPYAFYDYNTSTGEYTPVTEVEDYAEQISDESTMKSKINEYFNGKTNWKQGEDGINNGYPTLDI